MDCSVAACGGHASVGQAILHGQRHQARWLRALRRQLRGIEQKVDDIVATEAEVLQELADAEAARIKYKQDILDKLAALQTALDAALSAGIPQSVSLAASNLRDAIVGDDDALLNPPPPPPPV
jgi:hypothetical protein